MGILETIDAKVWVGDREQRIVPPGYKPRPVAASSEWLVSHSDWKRRSLAQRGTLLAEYASDEDADGPPRLRKQRDVSVDLRTSRVGVAQSGCVFFSIVYFPFLVFRIVGFSSRTFRASAFLP